MARTKEFDTDQALQAAMELFWAQGYAATSMADLVDHLGIARASIYGTFGGKEQLYLAALDRYSAIVDPQLVETLSRPGPVLPTIHALVQSYVATSTGTTRSRGCFVVNTAVELGPHDSAAEHRVQASWRHLETLLTAALTRAKAQHELAGSADPRTLARFLLVFLQGVRVTGKAAPNTAIVRDAAAQAVSLLSS